MASSLRKWGGSQFVQNSGWMLAGQGLRIGVQALYFILIARALGASEYGRFVGATALVAILAPFATWGAGNVLVKNVARDPRTFARSWGAALHAMKVSGVGLGLVAFIVARFVLPGSVSALLVAEVILADLVFARIVDMGGQAFQAFHRLNRTAALQFLISFVRLIGASIVFVIGKGHATALGWGALYMSASAVCAMVTIRLVHRELGRADASGRLSGTDLRDGFHFSVTNSAASVYNDIDKTMLARLSTLDAAGFYAAAYRILDVSFVPIRSILYAAYSRFFAVGANGIQGTLALARRLLPFGLIYGVGAGVALFVGAPILPHLLGPEYGPSVQVLRMLCVLPLLRTLHYFAADALTGADRQGTRTIVQAIVAAANVALNLWWIPRYSWRGAIWSTLACDGSLAIGLWALIGVLVVRARRGSGTAEQPDTPLAGDFGD